MHRSYHIPGHAGQPCQRESKTRQFPANSCFIKYVFADFTYFIVFCLVIRYIFCTSSSSSLLRTHPSVIHMLITCIADGCVLKRGEDTPPLHTSISIGSDSLFLYRLCWGYSATDCWSYAPTDYTPTDSAEAALLRTAEATLLFCWGYSDTDCWFRNKKLWWVKFT